MYNFSIGVILDSFKKSIPESLKLAADMGVQGIQAYATYGELSPQKLTGEKRREFLKMVKDHGLVLSALCGAFQKDAAYRIIAKRSDGEVRHGAMYCPLDLPSIVQSVPTAADGAFSFLVSDAAREEEYTLSWRCENGHAVLTEEKARGSIDAGVLFLTLLGVEKKEGAERDLLRCYPPMTTVLWEQY